MNNEKDKHINLKDYLQEVKAREKSPTLKEFADRFLFEDRVRKALQNLRKDGYFVQEGLVQITRLQETVKSFETPDFVVSKEDILFQLYLLIGENKGIIKKEVLRGLSDVIQNNPKLTALIIVWNLDGLPSCALDSFNLRKYVEKLDDNIDLNSEDIGNLEETICRFYNDQFIDWKIPDDFMSKEEVEEVAFNLSGVIERSIDEEFQKWKETSLKIPEKIEAQKTILKLDKKKVLDKLIMLLSKSKLASTDFEDFELFLDKELKKVRAKDD